MITDNDIIEIFYPTGKNFSIKAFKNLNKKSEIYEYLNNRYPDSSCIEETIKSFPVLPI